MGQLDVAGVADLGDHDNGADFFDLVVVGRGGAVEVAEDLDAEVGNGDEAFEYVFGHDVGEVVFFLDIVGGDVDVVGSGTEVAGSDCAGSPFSFAGEGLLFEL